MFVGHAAVALAAKSKAPVASLGWFLAASYGLDLIWPVFLLLGVERVEIAGGATAFTPLRFVDYPWSHSLLMSVVWGALFCGVAMLAGVARAAAILLGAVVVSHWFLDLAMHAPDLPLWPGAAQEFGLGLWNSVAVTLLVEGAVFATGIALYIKASRPRDRIGSLGLWALVAVLTAIWVSGPWAPPPPNVQAVAIAGLSLWLFVIWGAWVDRHRTTSSGD
jgi:hypothetical protein